MAGNKSNYEIKRHIAELSRTDAGYSMELNVVSWSGAAAKFDLRMWREKDGERSALKGITLTAEQLVALRTALDGLEVVIDA